MYVRHIIERYIECDKYCLSKFFTCLSVISDYFSLKDLYPDSVIVKIYDGSLFK